MRVVLDLSIVPHALGGVGRYVLGLASELPGAGRSLGMAVDLLDVPAAHPGLPSPEAATVILPDPVYSRIRGLRRAAALLSLERNSRASRLSRLTGADVFHHSGVQASRPSGAVSVVTFFDDSALEHPEWHTEDTVRYARREAAMVAGGAAVLAISTWAAERAARHFGEEARIGVAPGAADPLFSPGEPDPDVLRRFDLLPGGYLLHVGNFVPRKNIPFLLESYARARDRGLRMPLVMAGLGGWKSPEVGGDGVRRLDGPSDADLLSLYRGASALLLPSILEGLGLPVLEALACGCAVVAANTAALPGTLGGHGLLLDPFDGRAWADAMVGLESGSLSGELRARAASAPRTTWADAAAAAAAFYMGLAG